MDELNCSQMKAVISDEKMAAEVEKLCRWGAARAGAIVVLPGLGTLALLANEVYMIKKIAQLHELEFNETAACAFLGGLGGAFVGQTLATLIPVALLQIPIGIGVTYAVGKAAAAWIDDGMPDISVYKDKYKDIFKHAKDEAKELVPLLKESKMKDKPLGDENRKFDVK